MSPDSLRNPLILACIGSVVALAILTTGCADRSDTGQNASSPVHRVDQSADEPFAFLDGVLDSQRVVLLGESSHGVAEFYQRKSDLVRYLHEELGYGVLVFESGLADVATVYGDAAEMKTNDMIDKALLYNTDQLAPLFSHIRETKGTAEPLRLAGMDVQSKHFADELQSLIDGRTVDTEFLNGLRGRLWQKMLGAQDFQAYNRLSRRFVAKTDTLLRALNQSVPPDSRSYEEEALVRNVENFRDFFSFKYKEGKSIEAQFSDMQALRDSIMANNLFWLTETVFPEEKVIVWGHNGHIAKDNFETGMDVGEYVHRKMPEESYAMGFVAYQGAAFEEHQEKDTLQFQHSDPRMIEGRLAKLGAPEVFANFHDTTGRLTWISDSLQVADNTTFKNTIVPKEAFDGVYFIKTVSPENYLSGQ